MEHRAFSYIATRIRNDMDKCYESDIMFVGSVVSELEWLVILDYSEPLFKEHNRDAQLDDVPHTGDMMYGAPIYLDFPFSLERCRD